MGCAVVFRVKQGKRRSALKCVDLRRFRHEWKREKKILPKLKHDHVIAHYASFKQEQTGFIQMELMHGDLMDLLEARLLISQPKQAQIIYFQILQGLAYCHREGVAHLDIKPDNILLNASRDEAKLADFGCSYDFKKGVKIRPMRPFGTLVYSAPEVVRGESFLPEKADVWSAGILLYVILTGTWPYIIESDDLANLVRQGNLSLVQTPQITDEAMDLIKQMVQLNPIKRPSVATLLHHPWFNTNRNSPPQEKQNQRRRLVRQGNSLDLRKLLSESIDSYLKHTPDSLTLNEVLDDPSAFCDLISHFPFSPRGVSLCSPRL